MPRSVISKPTRRRFELLLLSVSQARTTNEIAFVQFADPTEISFQQRCGFVDLVTVESHGSFKPSVLRAASPQGITPSLEPKFPASRMLVPKLLGFIGSRINLKAVFARVYPVRETIAGTPSTLPSVKW